MTRWEDGIALGIENALAFVRSASTESRGRARCEVRATLVIVDAALRLLLKELRTEAEEPAAAAKSS